MSKNYEMASQEDVKLMNEIIDKHYKELRDYDIQIGLFYLYPKLDKDGNSKGPSIKSQGVACAANIRIVSDLNRLTDNTDVKIVLAQEIWSKISKEEKEAILDHELYHLVIAKDPKTDEPLTISETSDKVKLKMKVHNIVLWGFSDIIERHKMNSQELQILDGISKRYAPYMKAE